MPKGKDSVSLETILNEVISPGTRIRKIRRFFRLKQHEFCTGFSRGLLSDIENDKNDSLTPLIALKIVNNVNSIIKERNLNESPITLEDLMQSEEMQIKNKIKERIKAIEENFSENVENDLYMCIELIQMYNIKTEESLSVFNLLTEHYFKVNNIEKCKTNCLKAIQLAAFFNKNNIELELIMLLAKMYFNNKDYKQSLEYYKHALFTMNISNVDDYNILKKIYFNIGVNSLFLENYKNGLKYFQKVKNMDLNDKEKIEILCNEAACYQGLKDYKTSNIMYDKLLNLLDSEDEKNYKNIGLIFRNLGYMSKDDKRSNDNTKRFYENSIKYRELCEDNNISNTYFEYAVFLNNIGEFELSILNFKKAVSKKNVKAVPELIKLYIKHEKDTELNIALEEIIKNKLDTVEVLQMVIEYYCRTDVNKIYDLNLLLQKNRISN